MNPAKICNGNSKMSTIHCANVQQQKINIPEDEAVQKLGERKIRQRITAIFNRLAASTLY